MIIQAMPAGPSSLFAMTVFGRPDHQFQAYLQQRNQQTQQMLSQQYGFDSSNFFQNSQTFFHTYQELNGLKRAETMIAMGAVSVSDAIDINIFTPIVDATQFTAATPMQQTYLMANPLVRQMYLDQSLYGYKDTYTNHWGTSIAEEDPVYRHVTHGLAMSNYADLPEDVDEVYVQYEDDPIQGLQPLTVQERFNVVDAWNKQNLLIDEGIDPTDPKLSPIKT